MLNIRLNPNLQAGNIQVDSQTATDVSYAQEQIAQNDLRKKEQKKLFAYYNGNQDEIISHLNTALKITFLESEVNSDFQKNYINIVTKTVDQLSIVYRNAAKRSLIKEAASEEAKKQLTELTAYYNSLLFAVNTSDKMASRYAKLCNVALTYVYFDKGKIKYKVLPTWLYDVVVSDDDPYKIEMISYKTYYDDKLYRVVWTEKEHYRVEVGEYKGIETEASKKMPIGDNPDTKNPYGIIPYAVLRLKETGDFWGWGMSDLVNGNEQINIILTELMNEHILMGVGTVVAVNCNLATKTKDGTSIPARVNIGRKYPITIEGVKTDDVPPSLDYVSSDPQYMGLRETVDWYIKMFAMSKGLNPNSFLADVQNTSGFSKVMDAFEQMELRKDDIEPSRIFEDERFNITRIINNYHCDTTDKGEYKLQMIGKDIYLKVDFAEVETYLTPEEQRADDDWKLQHGLTSIIKIARRDNPDLSDEEIEVELAKDKAVADKYKTAEPKPITKPEEKPIEEK